MATRFVPKDMESGPGTSAVDNDGVPRGGSIIGTVKEVVEEKEGDEKERTGEGYREGEIEG